MHLNTAPSFSLVSRLALQAKSLGGRALLVGGCVRDQILGGVEPKDLDVEVFGVRQDEMSEVLRSIAPSVVHVGRAFPVWKVWDEEIGTAGAIDVALPRQEVKTGPHHTDFAVAAEPSMTFAAAAARRDFTINAIGYDPLTGEYLDPHGGIADIKAGVLRHVSPRFAEDPLRVLRGMQFAARFDLKADPGTIEFCKGLSAEGLSSERLLEEWKKLILKGKTPSRGLQFLRDTGWDRYFPEIAALRGVPQDPVWHPEGDVFTHTCLCLDAFANRRSGNEQRDLRVGLAVLLHDTGKATHTRQERGRWVAHWHEEAGGPPTEAFLRRITDQTDLIQGVRVLVERHMVPSLLHKEALKNENPESMDASVRRLAMQLGKDGVPVDELCAVVECDKAGRPPLAPESASAAWLRERASVARVLETKPKPVLQGRDLIALGMTPGVSFKSILSDAFELQLEGHLQTHEDAIAFARTRVPPITAPSSLAHDLRTAGDAIEHDQERPAVD